MRIKLILLLLLLSVTVNAQLIYKAGICAAYSMQKNWSDNQPSFFTVQVGGVFDYHKTTRATQAFHHLNTELSYCYYPDSIWKTNTDYVKLNLQWNKIKTDKWEQSTTVFFGTRYLNKYYKNGDQQYWQEGFLNPMELAFSYGWKKRVFKRSSVIVSLATLRMLVTPASKATTKNEATLVLKNKTTLVGQYGFQAQSFINEKFYNDRIQWINDSRIYFNEVSERGMLLDIHNVVAVKIYKYLELRIDSKLQYDYQISNKLRFKQEALLGFYYSNSKDKSSKD